MKKIATLIALLWAAAGCSKLPELSLDEPAVAVNFTTPGIRIVDTKAGGTTPFTGYVHIIAKGPASNKAFASTEVNLAGNSSLFLLPTTYNFYAFAHGDGASGILPIKPDFNTTTILIPNNGTTQYDIIATPFVTVTTWPGQAQQTVELPPFEHKTAKLDFIVRGDGNVFEFKQGTVQVYMQNFPLGEGDRDVIYTLGGDIAIQEDPIGEWFTETDDWVKTVLNNPMVEYRPLAPYFVFPKGVKEMPIRYENIQIGGRDVTLSAIVPPMAWVKGVSYTFFLSVISYDMVALELQISPWTDISSNNDLGDGDEIGPGGGDPTPPASTTTITIGNWVIHDTNDDIGGDEIGTKAATSVKAATSAKGTKIQPRKKIVSDWKPAINKKTWEETLAKYNKSPYD